MGLKVSVRTPAGAALSIAGPADLAGKTGTLVLEGEPIGSDAARWAPGVFAFIARGGEVTRR